MTSWHFLHFFVYLFQNLPKSQSIRLIQNDFQRLLIHWNHVWNEIAFSVNFRDQSSWISVHEDLFSSVESNEVSFGKMLEFQGRKDCDPSAHPHDQTWSVPHEVRWGVAKWFKLMCKIWTKVWPQLLDLDYSQCPCCPCA